MPYRGWLAMGEATKYPRDLPPILARQMALGQFKKNNKNILSFAFASAIIGDVPSFANTLYSGRG